MIIENFNVRIKYFFSCFSKTLKVIIISNIIKHLFVVQHVKLLKFWYEIKLILISNRKMKKLASWPLEPVTEFLNSIFLAVNRNRLVKIMRNITPQNAFQPPTRDLPYAESAMMTDINIFAFTVNMNIKKINQSSIQTFLMKQKNKADKRKFFLKKHFSWVTHFQGKFKHFCKNLFRQFDYPKSSGMNISIIFRQSLYPDRHKFWNFQMRLMLNRMLHIKRDIIITISIHSLRIVCIFLNLFNFYFSFRSNKDSRLKINFLILWRVNYVIKLLSKF